MTDAEYYFWRALALFAIGLVILASPIWVPTSLWRERRRARKLRQTELKHDARKRRPRTPDADAA